MSSEMGTTVTTESPAPKGSPVARSPLNVEKIRKDFPGLDQQVYGKPLAYLDNAATTQKPRAVIDAICHFYERDCANVHRGVHQLSARATMAFEHSRAKVQHFLGAADTSEIIFVRGATEAINLVAQSYGRSNVGPGDEVLITAMEHHSNIVPWQILCEQVGAKLVVAPINRRGELLLDEYDSLINTKTKLVAAVHVSNALGTVNPIAEMIQIAHRKGVPILVDGAQAAPHVKVNVQELDCDFYAISGHKMYGPTGIGVLYGKKALLEQMPPYQAGGDMIKSVTFEKTVYNDLPFKFEAGTPNIADAIGLGAAVDYLEQVGLNNIARHEHELVSYATDLLSNIPGLTLIGTAQDKASVVSFVLDNIHPHDIGTILDQEGVAIRTGHHCAQPVMEFFEIPATARASFGMYNTKQDVEALAEALEKVMEVFG